MSNTKQRLSAQVAMPGGHAVAALEAEAARIVAEDAERRTNGGTSLHIVGQDGVLSGFVKDAHTTIRFAGGNVAVTSHD
jgi:hypothetical protein